MFIWWQQHLEIKNRIYLVRINLLYQNALLRSYDGHPAFFIQLFFFCVFLIYLFVIIHPSVIEDGNKWPYSSLHLKERRRRRKNEIQYKNWFVSLAVDAGKRRTHERERDSIFHLKTILLLKCLLFHSLFLILLSQNDLVKCVNSRTFPDTILSRYLFMRIYR